MLRLVLDSLWDWAWGEDEVGDSSSEEEEEVEAPPRKRIRRMQGEEEVMDFALNPSLPQTDVLARGFGAELTRENLRRLRVEGWLDDEIINFEMNLLQQQVEQSGVLCLSTFFYTKLTEGNRVRFDLVENWKCNGKKISLNAHRQVLIPVYLATEKHWVLVEIDLLARELFLLDSMAKEGGGGQVVLENLGQWAERQTGWRFTLFRAKCQQQSNGSDCGVFVIAFAWQHLTGAAAIDTHAWRRRILLDLVRYNEEEEGEEDSSEEDG
ncbi:hypothetical protein BASA81_003691 [Batrachochytrium salamandrivorans]|nr:hypothetical protein BASA81_003691 [Batrachochytrium salamandrivorans]